MESESLRVFPWMWPLSSWSCGFPGLGHGIYLVFQCWSWLCLWQPDPKRSPAASTSCQHTHSLPLERTQRCVEVLQPNGRVVMNFLLVAPGSSWEAVWYGELEHKTGTVWPGFESGLHYSCTLTRGKWLNLSSSFLSCKMGIIAPPEGWLLWGIECVNTRKAFRRVPGKQCSESVHGCYYLLLFTQTLCQRVSSAQRCASLGKAVDGT